MLSASLALEIIIRNVELKQNALPSIGCFLEAVQLAVFRHFIIDVGSDLLRYSSPRNRSE